MLGDGRWKSLSTRTMMITKINALAEEVMIISTKEILRTQISCRKWKILSSIFANQKLDAIWEEVEKQNFLCSV